ncbi:tetratricopeptide repeat protein [Candidatus Pelagibacter sp.]|nr:tetratricopeptide repeat protein [Candidatus Pelagibacter sp.]
MKKNSLNINERLELAVKYHKEQKILEAQNLYLEILKLDTNNYIAHNNLGIIYILQNELEKAKISFEKALQIKPEYIDAKNSLQTVIQKLDIINEDEKNWKQLINKTPEKIRFIYDELKLKNFFSDSNIEQIKKGEEQLPLLTWPLLDFLKTINLKNNELFELGSGNSTIWLSKIFKQIQSFETDKNWYQTLKLKLDKNVSYNLATLEEIYECSFKFIPQNWLLIDFAGKRAMFIKKLIGFKDENLPAQIILDNSEWYRNSSRLLCDRGYTEIPFYGFKSGENIISCSSLFLLKNNFYLEMLPEFFFPNNSRKINNNWDSLD